MNAFANIPFFRILIPFVSGILLAIHWHIVSIHWFYFAWLIIPISLLIFYKVSTPLSKKTFLVLADLFLFMYGLSLVNLTDSSRQDLFYGKAARIGENLDFTAVIDDLPVEKQKTFKCNLQLFSVKSGAAWQKCNGALIAYFKKSAVAANLKPGNVILVKARLQEPQAPQNPYEFNYKAYLGNRQVYHIAFADSNAFKVLKAGGQLNAIWKTGLDCKAYILDRLKHSSLSQNSYAICSALLTGYDDDIDKPVMEAFSHSGTLHVLSVSGLHTGLIYLVLGFLFDLADRKKKYKLLKFSFITFVLWFFALITGFSAPVLRAVIMFNLLGLGKIYFRSSYQNQLNILCVSAFILLSYNPFFISDIGFQLSYLALFGLIYFQPKLAENWRPSSTIVNAVWQSTTASVAATLSTLPITLFYFKQFPIWFFLCNVVVVPATFVVLLLAVLVVLHFNFAAVLINYLVLGLTWFIGLFNHQGYGFIDMIHFDLPDLFYLSTLIILLSSAIYYRSYRQVAAALVVLICWQLTAVLISYKAKKQNLFSVYCIKNENIFSLKNKTKTILMPASSSNYNYHVKPHLISFNNTLVVEQPFNYFSKGDDKILVLDRPGFWPVADLKEITILVLCNNFKLAVRDLQKFRKLRVLVSSASNNSYTSRKSGELSRKFALDFYDLKLKGAYVLNLDEA